MTQDETKRLRPPAVQSHRYFNERAAGRWPLCYHYKPEKRESRFTPDVTIQTTAALCGCICHRGIRGSREMERVIRELQAELSTARAALETLAGTLTEPNAAIARQGLSGISHKTQKHES